MSRRKPSKGGKHIAKERGAFLDVTPANATLRVMPKPQRVVFPVFRATVSDLTATVH